MKRTLAAVAALTLAFATPMFAHDGVHVEDPYARAASPSAVTGAIFLEIVNHSTTHPDRLVAARSDVAERVELHTHQEDAAGVMTMVHVPEGFPIAPGETHALARGGDHIMLIGLKRPLVQGDVVTVTLTFEREGDMVIEVPVDSDRKPAMGGGHGMHKHGA